MLRYIAFIWDPDDYDSAARVASARTTLLSGRFWTTAYSVENVLVTFQRPADPSSSCHPLAANAGVVLGSLFRRHRGAASTPTADLGGPETVSVLSSSGRHLVENYWGAYIALIRDPHSRRCSVLRDPSECLACFHAYWGRVHVLFADLADVAGRFLSRLTVDWSKLATRLASGASPSRRCALQELEDIPGGEWTTLTGTTPQRTTVWHPDRFCNNDVIEDAAEAASALRTTVRDAVQTLSAQHSHVLLELSGGLDSSIVAACLAHQEKRPQVTCLNFFIPTTAPDPTHLVFPVGLAAEDRAKLRRVASSGDERRFARRVARACGFPLIEREKRMLDLRDPRAAAAPPAPWPSGYVFSYEDDAAECEYVTESNVTGCFSGHGGDTVFYATQRSLGAIDYAYQHPLSALLCREIRLAAALSRESTLRVLSKSVRYGILRRPLPPPIGGKQPHLLCDEIARQIARHAPDHPWMNRERALCPGKQLHVLGIALSIPLYDQAYYREKLAPAVHPLATQPVIELALRIPTYVLLAEGVSRGLARRVFACELPSDIIERTVKGTSSEYWYHVVHHNAAFLRERLMDGRLAQQGLLDREKLRQCLDPESPLLGVPPTRLMDYLACELWLAQLPDIFAPTRDRGHSKARIAPS